MVLASPWPLGRFVAPSRALFGPHCTNLGHGRSFSEAHDAYYARRAQGGCGVVVTETISLHESDWPYERAPLARALGHSLARLASAVHGHGALVLASLGHTGMQGSTAYSQGVLWAPSLVPHVLTREMPIAMTNVEIDELRRATVVAASVAVAAECDGVEINAGQFSLFRQFMSGLTNLRDDEWSDRTRLVATVLEEVRDAIGESLLGLRVVADELAPWAGITPELAREMLPVVTAVVDYVVFERGSIFSEAATRPDMQLGTTVNRTLIATVRDCVAPGVAVVGQGSIVEAVAAEELLTSGLCDGVEMTRAQIADPDLVARARGEVAGRTRPCTLCNQGCQVRDVRNPLVSCAVNAVAGHELGEIDVSEDGALRGQSVTIAGGGVAGLVTARGAALRGAAVTVHESSAAIGGALITAAALPGRERWLELLAWLESEVERLGVTVKMTSTVSGADVVAVGRTVARASFRDGSDGSLPVLTVTDALTAAIPRTVAVLDLAGDAVGVGIAERLATGGADVTLITPDLVAGVQLSLTGDLVAANARLAANGVTLVTHTVAVAIAEGTIVLEDRFSGATRSTRVDAVVFAGFDLPAVDLFDGALVGDAVAPRTVNAAVREGHRAALALRGVGAP